jgi:hypothetical protein
MGVVPRAKDFILRFIEQGMSDPTFAPVHLVAKLSSVDATVVRTDIVRAGDSLWDGDNYRGTMSGQISSYPLIDLAEFPWSKKDGLSKISFESMRDGRVLAAMQSQLDRALTALPFQLCPAIKSIDALRERCVQDDDLRRYFPLKLVREDVPSWITGLDQIYMNGSWRVFIPRPSPEWNLLQQVFARERSHRMPSPPRPPSFSSLTRQLSAQPMTWSCDHKRLREPSNGLLFQF